MITLFIVGAQPSLFNSNQQKPGSLLGGGGLFGNNTFGTNTSSAFPLLQNNSQVPGQG